MMRKLLITLGLFFSSIICTAQSDIIASISFLNDLPLDLSTSSINSRVLLGVQTCKGFIMTGLTYETCYWFWDDFSRMKNGNFRIGGFLGVDPFAAIDKNNYIKVYLMTDAGVLSPEIPYFGIGARVLFGTETWRAFIQDNIGFDYYDVPYWGHRIELGVQVNLGIK